MISGRKKLEIVNPVVVVIDRQGRNMDIPVGGIRGFEQLRHHRRVTDRHTFGNWSRG
jgi:hypothetical protein